MAIFEAMRRLLPILVSVLFLSLENSFSQEGLPFLTEVEIDGRYSNSRIGSIIQDGEETMFFSTSRGVLKFDGSTWELITTPSPATEVFYHQASNRIFVALKNGAAEILQSDSGTYKVQAIPGVSANRPVNRIINEGTEVYFIGDDVFYALNPLKDEDARTFEFEDRMINGAFVFRQNLFLIFYQEGLFTWSNNELVSVGKHEKVTDDQMLFSFQTNNGTYVGFDHDVLFLFNGNSFKPVRPQLEKFLNENLLSDGLLLNDSLMALSTLAGGAIIVNTDSQTIKHRFDYATGVKDNEIFCLGKDGDEGLWLAFESGLSRVDINQPVKSFKGFPGLEGNVTTSLYANGKLFVGTGSGVFMLQKATSSAEINRMMQQVARRNRQLRESQNNNYIPPQPKISSGTEKKKALTLLDKYKANPDEVKKELSKKELRELKRKLRKQRKEERKNKPAVEVISEFFTGEKADNVEVEVKSGPKAQSLIPNPKTGPAGSGMTAPPGSRATNRSKPQVLNKAKNQRQNEADQQRISNMQKAFLFKKINGLDVKCRQLIQVEDQVFAATNNGLHIINGNQSSNLTPGLYINHVSKTTSGNKLLLASHNGVYELAKSTENEWRAQPLNSTAEFVAYNAAQADDGSIWAGTDNGAYRYFLDEVKYYALPDVANERVIVSNVYGQMHFLLPSALFHHVPDSDTILPAHLPDVPSSGQLDYLLGNNGVVWIKSLNGWRVLNGEKFAPLLPYMDLFENIIDVSTDTDGNVYVIDKGDNIYSIRHQQEGAQIKFNLYIRQVADANGNTFSLEQMNFESDQNALVFNVSAPFYLKSQGTKYQYRIEGPMSKWSKWRSDSQIEPGMLSPGDYILEVRAKNILGEVSEIKTLAFTVEQHLFLRWYALLGYTLLLTLVIFGIIKKREHSLKETQRELEEKVAQRTADLAKAKEQAEGLLLNILPKETAEELKLHGKATAKSYNQVSVLFTDFKGFTQFAENTKPQDLVNELHRCFVKFDEIVGKYNLEKIKTIGDAYMCAGGVPIQNNHNAIASVLAALEIRDFMAKTSEHKKQNNEQVLEIRIGIHTGPITAGVVGVKKFAYDIWGDTVNMASRMETASEPGKLNVSATTYELIKKYFDCEARGKKTVKGKGAVEMYFVNGIKADFSKNGDGKLPNDRLWDVVRV